MVYGRRALRWVAAATKVTPRAGVRLRYCLSLPIRPRVPAEPSDAGIGSVVASALRQ
jgi:hypothetical protein